jgi:hypothetical protein
MTHTYEELQKMTIDALREIAKGLDDESVQGYTQMNKDHLLPALCRALGIEAHAHHEVVGINKRAIKAEIRRLKEDRDKALEAHDRTQLKGALRKIHQLKRRIRRATH